MRHFTSSTLCATAILFVSTTPASAQGLQTVSYQTTLAEQPTNWTQSAQLQRFDPSLGTLQSIEFTVTETVTGAVQMESLDSAPSVVLTHFESFLRILAPDSTILEMPIPMADYQDTLSAFDGTVDYLGTSGLSHDEITVTHSVTHALPSTTNLGAYTGAVGAPGSMTVTVTALGLSSSTGGGNVITRFEQRANASIVVTYGFLGNTPPTFTNCTSLLMASVGVPLTYQICALDSDSTAPVTLSVSGLPPGATLSTPLPASGNPVCTTLTWAPSSSQVGTTTITFTATDANLRTSTCVVSILTAECHLILGLGLGNTQELLFGQLFDTQLSAIRRSYPVTMEDHPGLPWLALPQTFYVQVVMHNPQIFPSNPDQWTYAMRVDKDPVTRTLHTSYYGTENGMQVTTHEYLDTNGIHRVKFPFTIDGM